MRNARIAGGRFARRRNGGSLSLVTAFLFFVAVASTTLLNKDMSLVFAAYVVLSMLTFATYAVDKSSARKGAWRISEITLHILSLAGGWPGALIAQQVLRHKTRKESFRFVFRVTAILNGCVFVWLFTTTGTSMLRILVQAVRNLLLN